MTIAIHKPEKVVAGQLHLPGSKSISNRVLMIRAISGASFAIQNLSNSDDTRHLEAALNRSMREATSCIDIGHAGTDMRFLTAYLAAREGTYELTGSLRMQQRPVGPLVEALRVLGADISYMKQEGFPPLLIRGRKLRGGIVNIRADISSQFITALLLVAPGFDEALELRFSGKMVSKPYVDMTVTLMRLFGAEVTVYENCIVVAPQVYGNAARSFVVESDWSAASYYYSVLALSPPGTSLSLRGLSETSTQADAACTKLYQQLGVCTTFADDEAVLSKTEVSLPGCLEFDFTDCPDIAQTLACTCAGLNLPFLFTGLQTLKVKETDRILALQHELAKLGMATEATHSSLTYNGKGALRQQPVEIATYQDHRMAMSFAPLALVFNGLSVADAGVVSKSYPRFWDDLLAIGFSLQP